MKTIKRIYIKYIIITLIILLFLTLIYCYRLKIENNNYKNVITAHELHERMSDQKYLSGILITIIKSNENDIVELTNLEKYILEIYNKKGYSTDYSKKEFVNNYFYTFYNEFDNKFIELVDMIVSKDKISKAKLSELYINVNKIFDTLNDKDYVIRFSVNSYGRKIITKFNKDDKEDILNQIDYCIKEFSK